MHNGPIRNWADISVFDADIETLLHRKIVELVVDVVGVLDVLFKADDRKPLKGLRLVNHGIKAVRVIQGPRNWRVCGSSGRRLLLLLLVLIATGGLLREVGCLEDLRLLEYLGFDSVRVQLDVQSPLLDLLALGNHLVQLLDRVNSVVRLLEETLAHLSNSFLILPHLLGDSNQHGEFGRQVNVLALLLDFKEWLVHLQDLLIVLLFEVGGHRDGGASLSLLEIARLRAHIEAHVADLVGLVVAVHGHDDGALELIKHSLLVLLGLWCLVGVAVSLLSKALHLLIDQLETVVNRQILADIVNDQVEAALENPR